jgi:integrase
MLGAPGLHFHDLRHTGDHLAAQVGAPAKELMARMGHDDMRPALIHQHATDDADRRLAERLSGLVDEQRGPRPDDDEGPPARSSR